MKKNMILAASIAAGLLMCTFTYNSYAWLKSNVSQTISKGNIELGKLSVITNSYINWRETSDNTISTTAYHSLDKNNKNFTENNVVNASKKPYSASTFSVVKDDDEFYTTIDFYNNGTIDADVTVNFPMFNLEHEIKPTPEYNLDDSFEISIYDGLVDPEIIESNPNYPNKVTNVNKIPSNQLHEVEDREFKTSFILKPGERRYFTIVVEIDDFDDIKIPHNYQDYYENPKKGQLSVNDLKNKITSTLGEYCNDSKVDEYLNKFFSKFYNANDKKYSIPKFFNMGYNATFDAKQVIPK